jgi:hypothetical protein
MWMHLRKTDTARLEKQTSTSFMEGYCLTAQKSGTDAGHVEEAEGAFAAGGHLGL